MPRKPSDKLRVPLNCLIAPATKAAITGIQNETKESQGEIVDRSIALLAFREEVSAIKIPKAKPSDTENSRKLWDMLSTREKPPIENGTITHLDAVSENRGKATVETWRSGRKPLLKPSERQKGKG